MKLTRRYQSKRSTIRHLPNIRSKINTPNLNPFLTDANYVFIGYSKIETKNIPIVVPRETFFDPSQKKSAHNLSNNLLDYLANQNFLVVPYLYKLPHIRNIDALELLLSAEITLLDEKSNILVPPNTCKTTNSTEIYRRMCVNMFNDIFEEIERKYPNLFKPLI